MHINAKDLESALIYHEKQTKKWKRAALIIFGCLVISLGYGEFKRAQINAEIDATTEEITQLVADWNTNKELDGSFKIKVTPEALQYSIDFGNEGTYYLISFNAGDWHMGVKLDGTVDLSDAVPLDFDVQVWKMLAAAWPKWKAEAVCDVGALIDPDGDGKVDVKINGVEQEMFFEPEKPSTPPSLGLEFDLPESEWENSVVIHPDGTYRVWESKDGKIWGYGDVIEPKQ